MSAAKEVHSIQVSSYNNLLEEIARLGEPQRGYVRVFRGQTKDHGKMLPTGSRPGGAPWSLIWFEYSRMLLKDLLNSMADETNPENLETWVLWLQAIAQHYGPGSYFLDVTTNVEIALWFAFHRAEEAQNYVSHESLPHLQEIVDYPAPDEESRRKEFEYAQIIKQDDQIIEVLEDRVRIKRDIPILEFYASYQPFHEEHGFLYVFDVPEWNGHSDIAHGQLINLQKAPKLFSSSRRMVIQDACMLAADPSVYGGDLSSFCKCKFSIKWPSDAPASLLRSAEEMFPQPSRDPWYERFLSIPFVIKGSHFPSPGGSLLQFARPLPVTVYLPDKLQNFDDMKRYTTIMDPPLVYLEALKMNLAIPKTLQTWLNCDSDQINKCRLDGATHILLETPLMSSVPDTDNGWWNHGILASGFSDEVELINYELSNSETPIFDHVTLLNVFFEFSPLENTVWGAQMPTNAEVQLFRGLWLIRQQGRFIIFAFFQHLSAPKAANKTRLLFDGPMCFEYDASLKRFKFRIPSKEDWTIVTGSSPIDKPFFLALAIIRALSPLIKADPFPIEYSIKQDNHWCFEFRVTEAPALLLKVATFGNGSFYLLKDALRHSNFKGVLTNEPFIFSSEVTLENKTIESKVLWSEVDPDEIKELTFKRDKVP